MKTPITVLLTCVGGMPSPGMIQHLQVLDEVDRVVGVDMNPDAIGKHFADAFYVVPHGHDVRYLVAIEAICQTERVDVVIPCSDEEAIRLYRCRKEVSVPIVGSEGIGKGCVSYKNSLMRSLSDAGVPVPKWYAPHSLAEAQDAAKHDFGYPLQPIIAKPKSGRGGRGVWLICPKQRWRTNREIDLDSFLGGFRCESVDDWIFMEYLPGADYTVEFLADNGRLLLAVAHERIKTAGSTIVGRVVNEPDLIGYTRQIVKVLGLHSIADVQIKRRADGTPMVYECNPRVGASVVLSAAAGVDLLRYAIRQAIGLPVPTNLQPEPVTMTRYWEEHYAWPLPD